MNSNIFSLFQERFSANPDKPFLKLPDASIFTFAEIERLSGQFATCLLDAGIAPGDRVVVQVEKSAAAVALYLGCLRVGAVYIPLNTAYTAAEVEYFLLDAQPGVLVCRSGDENELATRAEQAGVNNLWCLDTDHDSGLWATVQTLAPQASVVAREPNDLAAILYTSGTTGRSKGAMLSHGNLASNAAALHKVWHFEPDDVLLHALPLFHIHGLFVALHCAMINASSVIFLPGFKVDDVITHLTNATVMMGVPTFYTRLLERQDFDATSCRTVRLFISGSAPMTESTHHAFTGRTGHHILERYGMTEAGIITTNPYLGERIPGTVGYPLPGTSLRVCDNSGRVQPAGETGLVEIRGPSVFQGYWKMPDKTAQEFRDDGYFITGDLGVLDEDGCLSIVGRQKDLIISGGYNVYPKEIEICLDQLNGIAESAVIGLPHPDLGEAVTAILVAEGNEALPEADIKAQLADKLAGFKRPKQVFFCDSLPRNTMGKVQKNILRERFKDTYTH